MATTFDVKTQGVEQLINRLMGFEEETYKVLQKDIKSAADLIGSSARGLLPTFPMSGWGSWEAGRLDYYGPSVAKTIKPGFRTRQVGGQRYVMGTVSSSSAAGKIYQLAGSKSDDSAFSRYMNDNWGPADKGHGPRALAPAWRIHVEKARNAIQDAVNRAAAKVG